MIKYKEYKVSDPIIGFIPFHWNLIRSKYILREREARSVDGSEDLLSVSQYTGVTRRKDRKKDSDFVLTRALSLTGYKTVDVDNLVVNIMLAWNGSLGVSKYAGITSPAYGVYEINEKAVPKYIDYLIRTDLYKALFKLKSTGVIDSRLRLYTDQLYTISLVLPPKDEQIKIAHYLDYKNYQINKYIRIKKRQIELLKELKQTIINDAVTGKIDVRTGKPYPKYKDSGVDWLGMIPDDWVLRKLKQVASIKPSGVDKLSKEDEVPVNLCNYTDVYNNEYITSDMTFMSATVTKGEFADYSLLKGDIVVTKDSEIWNDIGVPALIIQDIADLVCAYHLCIIRPFHEDLESKFILRALQAKAYQYQFHIRANGITRYGISKNAIGYALIAVPPYDVQKSICVHVNESCLMIDAQIENINNQIPVIKELQNRLISDVVTGKMDVREIAVPDLPDEELEPAYEMEEEPVEEIENAD